MPLISIGPDEIVSRLKKITGHSRVVESFKETMRLRNVETFTHIQRLENMSIALAQGLGLDASGLDRLMLLASMHDVGKVMIPDTIINKPEPLDAQEWEVVRSHCSMGRRIAMTSRELAGIADEIYYHHERWDGKGYPEGISGDEIPVLSSVISVLDAYDAMTHTRLYRYSISHDDALREIVKCSGTQFAPDIAALFIDVFGGLSEHEMLAFIYNDPKHHLKTMTGYTQS